MNIDASTRQKVLKACAQLQPAAASSTGVETVIAVSAGGKDKPAAAAEADATRMARVFDPVEVQLRSCPPP